MRSCHAPATMSVRGWRRGEWERERETERERERERCTEEEEEDEGARYEQVY